MSVDKENKSKGTICITDRRRESARHPETKQRLSATNVMSQPGLTAEILQAAAGSEDRANGDHALQTLRDSQRLIHLGRLAASIAHEVNNPLESVTNLLYLIRSEPGLSQTTLDYLELAEREMKRVVSITRQTLSFARETSEPVELSLPGLLAEVLELYRRQIDQKQLRIVQRYASTGILRVFPGEIRQVLANLIVNAIEASNQRGFLNLRARPATSRDSTGIRITIADNGSGIPPRVRAHLGKPFFTTKGQGGTGLGLWVSRSIIERYGGRLRMRSVHISEPLGKSRHGTVFSLFLPLKTAQAPSGSSSNSRPVLVPRAEHPPRAKAGPSHRRTIGAD